MVFFTLFFFFFLLFFDGVGHVLSHCPLPSLIKLDIILRFSHLHLLLPRRGNTQPLSRGQNMRDRLQSALDLGLGGRRLRPELAWVVFGRRHVCEVEGLVLYVLESVFLLLLIILGILRINKAILHHFLLTPISSLILVFFHQSHQYLT